ncbi:alpha/beta fold hydrolase [Aquipseudomonas guryensis]|uniref:Alpha/beta hydrolase n=1 Tax=Aquipseudomonas guryensis TaxID=2759165 RepID=A0A7W4H4E5_9GAMM|nr:alpha/beta hydrolase [Pseudomonas guryensis]MBB1520526.1 alpha/beta hydrolase [Pseudomonas guryensis]
MRTFTMIKTAIATTAIALGAMSPAMATQGASDKPTVVLVHGAFAESASWNGVATQLQAQGYPVVAAANPLRGVKHDADYVASIVAQTSGPVILVGHSYGGSVISNAVHDQSNVKALVYVAAFAPEKGETAIELSGRYPGSTLGPTLATPVTLKDGNKDLYIQQDKFAQQFAADVAAPEAALMAASQRPITENALHEASGAPAWKQLPSWFIYGSADKNIPAAALKFMADRAGSKKTVTIQGASHVVMTSNPEKVAALIIEAAEQTAN